MSRAGALAPPSARPGTPPPIGTDTVTVTGGWVEILVTVSVVVTVAPPTPGRRSWEDRPSAGGVGCSFWGAENVAVMVVTKVVEGLVIVLVMAKLDSVGVGSDSGGSEVAGGGFGTVTVLVRVVVDDDDDGVGLAKGSVGESPTTVVMVLVAVPAILVIETVFEKLPVRLLVVGSGMVTFPPKILRAVFLSRHFSPTPSVTFMGTAKQPVPGAQGWMSKDSLVPQTPMLPEIHAAWFLTHGVSAFRSA